MLSPLCCRALVPVCLALGALASVLPALADIPTVPAAQASAPQIIVLQHVVPAEDSEPRQVQITFALVNASAAGLDASDVTFPLTSTLNAEANADTLNQEALQKLFFLHPTCYSVWQLLQTFTKQGSMITRSTLTTASNVTASFDFGDGAFISYPFAVNARVNTDYSVTLLLQPAYADGWAIAKTTVQHTIKDGETMVCLMPSSGGDGKSVLLFATPNVLPEQRNHGHY